MGFSDLGKKLSKIGQDTKNGVQKVSDSVSISNRITAEKKSLERLFASIGEAVYKESPDVAKEGLEDERNGSPECVQPVKFVGVTSGQQQEVGKNIDAQQDQADAEDDPHLLNDRREYEVGLHERDARRHALHQARAEQASEADREQGLRDLVPVPVDTGPRIQEYLYPHPHVREQEIAQHRGNSSQKEASEEIAPLPAGEEQQDNVYEIKDERAAQVPRQYKDPDMHSRSCRQEHDVPVRTNSLGWKDMPAIVKLSLEPFVIAPRRRTAARAAIPATA